MSDVLMAHPHRQGMGLIYKMVEEFAFGVRITYDFESGASQRTVAGKDKREAFRFILSWQRGLLN